MQLFVTGATEVAVARRCLVLFEALANFGPRSTVHQYLCAGSDTADAGFDLVILVGVFRPCERKINPFRISIYRQDRVETTSRPVPISRQLLALWRLIYDIRRLRQSCFPVSEGRH